MRHHSSLNRVRSGDIVIYSILVFAAAITLYPFIYVISMSISDPIYVIRREVYLFPKGFSLTSYERVFEYKDIWRSYYNSLWYAIVGTVFNLVLTTTTAYPLAQSKFFARKCFMIYIVIPMFISGGMIPAFILVNMLGIYNTRWAIILPAAMSSWNVILMREYIRNLPYDLYESAKIDGCGDIKILIKIIIPLSKPIIAVIMLYSIVGFWNSYFTALLYLPDASLQPIQLYLIKIVIQNSQEILQSMEGYDRILYYIQMKYSVIVVTILPILSFYPFLQRFFVQGIMIGSLKG
jgi:putative aldouronate transport system permease protein